MPTGTTGCLRRGLGVSAEAFHGAKAFKLVQIAFPPGNAKWSSLIETRQQTSYLHCGISITRVSLYILYISSSDLK
jgi:hypothetical protein